MDETGGGRTVLNYNKRYLKDVSCLESSDKDSCRSVLELHLCFNYITEVPAHAFALYSRLTHLSLACNNLTSIPASLSVSCPQLKYLRAPNNQIIAILNLEGLESLECLDLRYNRITSLDNLLSLTQLKELSVSDNMIHTVCWPQVPSLPSLTFLGLYGNKLTDLENTVLHLKERTGNLRRLNIGCNPFCQDRQLSLQSVLLTMGHLSYAHGRKLFLRLGKVFTSASLKKGVVEDALSAEVDVACTEFARGLDCERLKTVTETLLKLKVNFPLLERVDENALPK